MHTFGVEEWDDAQLTLCHVKRVLQVMPGVGVLQLIKVNQVRPKDEARSSDGGGGHGIKCQQGSPGRMQRPRAEAGKWLSRSEDPGAQ